LKQKFEQEDIQTSETIWELTGTPKLKPLIEKYCEKDVKELAENIIKAFENKILPVIDSFQKGHILYEIVKKLHTTSSINILFCYVI
jgi:hypothetical protein